LEFKNIDLVEKVELQAKSIKIQTELYRPAGLFMFNNKLIVCDYTNNDIFKVFSAPEIKFLYSFGNIGQGPDDFVNIIKSNINVSKYFEILSRNKLSYFEINDSSAVRMEKQPLVITKVDPVNNFRKLNDSLYILNNEEYSDKYNFEFRSFNLDSKKENTLGEVIYFDKSLKADPIPVIYLKLMNSVIYNEKNKKIVVFYYHYPVFKILSDKGDLLNLFSLKNDIETLSVDIKGENNVFFGEPYSTDEYIFVLWVNKTKREIEIDPGNFKPELLVFDWNGNLVKRFGLDKPVISFAVSEDCEKIYSVSINEDDISALYEYNISVINEKKQASSSSAYRIMENRFYTMEAPNALKFIGNETEINKTMKYDDCLVNANLIGQGEYAKDKDLGTVKLIYYIKGYENTSFLQSDELFSEHSDEDRKTEMIEIDGKNIFHISYTVHSKDMDGAINTLYENVFFFKQDGKLIKLSVITKTPKFHKYYADFLHMISSFSLKTILVQ
jgi:hypothetical protein